MANLSSVITLTKSEYRPCVVHDKNALFHMWTTDRKIIKIGNHKSRTIESTLGIVEFEDGTVSEVLPERIKFIDNKLKEYCFENGN